MVCNVSWTVEHCLLLVRLRRLGPFVGSGEIETVSADGDGDGDG